MKQRKGSWVDLLLLLTPVIAVMLMYRGVAPVYALLIPFASVFIRLLFVLEFPRRITLSYFLTLVFVWLTLFYFERVISFINQPSHSLWGMLLAAISALFAGVCLAGSLSGLFYYILTVRMYGFLLLAAPLIGVASRQLLLVPLLAGMSAGFIMGMLIPEDPPDLYKNTSLAREIIPIGEWLWGIGITIMALVQLPDVPHSAWSALLCTSGAMLGVSLITRRIHLRHAKAKVVV